MDSSYIRYSHRKARRLGPESCPNCADFDWDQLQRNPFDIFFSRLDGIGLAATSGCSTCQILSRAVEHCYPYTSKSPRDYRIAFHGLHGPMRWDVVHQGEDMRDLVFRKNRFVELFSSRGDNCPWPLVGAANHFTLDLDNAVRQVSSWLLSCQNDHPKCNIEEGTPLPRRVVRISERGGDGSSILSPHPHVRLHETRDGEVGEYACLSHCWGKSQIITTTSDNVEKHKRGIEWSALSRTFQEAIVFASEMGLEYLWIDSLCIIQNSHADWEAEAVKMASYYINSEFTIAATASSDGSGGLYHPTPLEETTIEMDGWDPKSSSAFHVGARQPLVHIHDVLEDKAKTNGLFPLLSRGWVFQERILSRRFIHFGPREVHWECHEEVLCQCGGIKAALELNPSGTETANQAMSITESKLKADEMVFLWVRQVENLTQLNFTYISDQLPALAGIATLMQQSRPSGRYLAGLWQDGLLFWLCWSTRAKGTRAETLAHVPSWSWASIQGQITYDFTKFYFMKGPWGERGHRAMLLVKAARVRLEACVPDIPPLSGRLDTGVIEVTGDAVLAKVHCKHEEDGDVSFKLVLATESPGGDPESNTTQYQWPFQCDTTDQHTSSELDGQSVLVLHLLTYEMLDHEMDGPSWMRSMLVLKPVDGHHSRCRRVGILCTDITGSFLPSTAWRSMVDTYGQPEEDMQDEFLRRFRKESVERTIRVV